MVNQLRTELKRSKYRLLGLIGQGQFGRVFCAVHRKTGRLVALKNLEQQRFPTHKFLRELRFLLSLQHDNIVTCQALEHTATGRYLVMDYCEGGTMRGLMNEDYRLRLFESLVLINDVLAGLEHAHHRGIVHCDIKPENILLNVRTGGWRARISDFGIAKLSQELRSADGAGNTGSPAYMAPERFYGQYSTTSDIYSVGVMLYELLTGDRPFQGTPSELMSAHLNTPLVIPDSVPEICRPIVTTALQKLSARRFRTAGEMRVLVQEAIAHLQSRPASSRPEPLLRYVQEAGLTGFSYEQATLLKEPIAQLEHDPDAALDVQLLGVEPAQRICWRMGQQIGWTAIPKGDWAHVSDTIADWQQASLPDPVLALWLRPQGCFAATARSLFLVPMLTLEDNHGAIAQHIIDSPQPTLSAVDPKGQWIAIATNAAYEPPSADHPKDAGDNPGSTLQFVRSPLAGDLSLPSQAIRLFKPGRTYNVQQLIALDSRHVAVIAQRIDPQTQTPQGMVIEVLNRRGMLIGSLPLSVCIGTAIRTPNPYRLLASDACNPYSLVIVDLKPHRIMRLGVEIQPFLLAATSWGYVVVDPDGQILLLGEQGDRIERISGPKSPTAIAMPTPHTLLLSTWQQNYGSLYRVNLKQLDIDLLF